MNQEQELKARIFRKLARLEKWGESHTSIDNLQKSFPKHLAGNVKNIGKELIKERYLLPKPTKYGLEISLNPEKSQEILGVIRAFFNEKL